MSDKRSGVVEALQLAIETEKKGYRFYRIAAESTSDPKGKEVFNQLAQDEIEHMGVFTTLYASLTNDEPWLTYEEALAKFGEAEPDEVIFPDEPIERQKDFDDLRALEEALEFEKKAVHFYQEQVKKVTGETAKAFYEKLVEIEEGHVMVIQAEIDSLAGAGFWLGYQEISLEH